MPASPVVPVPVTPPVSGHSRPARSSRLSVRASPEELAAWAGTARLLGHETTALWVRFLLKEAALTGHDGMAVGVSLRKLRGELGRIGNNLNQLAHSAHCGDAVRAGDVLDALEETKNRVDVLLKSMRVTRPRRTSRQRQLVEPEAGIKARAGVSQPIASSPATLH